MELSKALKLGFKSPVALEFASEVKKAVVPDKIVDDTMRRERELKELQVFLVRNVQKGETTGMEKMIMVAIRNNTPPEVIDAMKNEAKITDARFAELQKQAQAN